MEPVRGERRYEPRRPRKELRFMGRRAFMERMESQTRCPTGRTLRALFMGHHALDAVVDIVLEVPPEA